MAVKLLKIIFNIAVVEEYMAEPEQRDALNTLRKTSELLEMPDLDAEKKEITDNIALAIMEIVISGVEDEGVKKRIRAYCNVFAKFEAGKKVVFVFWKQNFPAFIELH